MAAYFRIAGVTCAMQTDGRINANLPRMVEAGLSAGNHWK